MFIFNKSWIVASVFVLLISNQASAGWMANADFSACPRKSYPELTRSEGPFNSESDCNAKVAQARKGDQAFCIKYSCTAQTGTTNESSSAAAPGHELDKNIGDALAAGMQGNISAVDTVGLVSMGLMGNMLLAPNQPDRQKSTAEIEADRVANEKYAADRARYERESEEKKDMRVAPILALLDPVPNKTEVYSKAFEHASQCISHNAGTACSGSTAEQQQNCVSDYNAGYELGAKQKEFVLKEAFQAGQGAAKRGESNNSFGDKRATGPCRLEWIDSYKQGYNKNEKTGH